MKALGWSVLTGATAIALAACGSARRGEPIAGPHVLQKERVQRGELVFEHNCTRCHPGGEAGLGPSLNDKPLPKFLVHFQVRKGLGVMPGFDENEISGAEMDDLLDYMVELRRHD